MACCLVLTKAERRSEAESGERPARRFSPSLSPCAERARGTQIPNSHQNCTVHRTQEGACSGSVARLCCCCFRGLVWAVWTGAFSLPQGCFFRCVCLFCCGRPSGRRPSFPSTPCRRPLRLRWRYSSNPRPHRWPCNQPPAPAVDCRWESQWPRLREAGARRHTACPRPPATQAKEEKWRRMNWSVPQRRKRRDHRRAARCGSAPVRQAVPLLPTHDPPCVICC
jgi:hypothetical protein